MNIRNFISENSAFMANNYIEELKTMDPEELNQATKLFNNLTGLAIHILKESPEFRMQFAEIHKEFLKYPECREVIEECLNAVSRHQIEYQSELNRH